MHRVTLDPAAISQYWLYWVKTSFPIINFPVYFQYYLPLLFPFKSLFYKLGLTKLALTNQNLQEGGWESVLFITSAFNDQTSQGNPTTEQLNFSLFTTNARFASVLSSASTVLLPSMVVTYTYLSVRTQLKHHLISLPPHSHTCISYLLYWIMGS